jgi:DNA topoisomerase-3
MQERDVLFKFTSVCGHLTSVDFPPKFNNWDKVDPFDLFDAEVIHKEATPGLRLMKHLEVEAKSSKYLVLWLDCDKEGENICFEVLDAISGVFRISFDRPQTVFRAKFSSITDYEIKDAMRKLGVPNQLESLSVDARKDIDLRVGCSFTRFQTRFFHEKYGDLDSSLISFGPCQTPTLGFCVDRHDQIQSFVPVPYWVLTPTVRANSEGSSPAIVLSWSREREFDHQAAQGFYNKIKSVTKAKVTSVQKKEKRRPPPIALNTVELLRSASSSMGIGPHQTMQVAERLYTQGYISYPRTETTRYSEEFPFKTILDSLKGSREWGDHITELFRSRINCPRTGKDHGDHPPIHPLKLATRNDLGDRDSWAIYEYVCRHFLATISPDFIYESTKVTFDLGGEVFFKKGSTPLSPGFTAVMPWIAANSDDRLPSNIKTGDDYIVVEIKINERKTSPPDYLSEADLISLMEKHGIGTDASIPTHINNICQRNYVKIESGRRLVPTRLGIVLVHGYQKIDRSLVLPTSRADMERELNDIAAGKRQFKEVLKNTLDDFKRRFLFFRENIAAMDELFQVSFSSLADSGKPLSKCGHCKRFMKLITTKPVRLYCPNCNNTLSLPHIGNFRSFKERTCPHDGFELLYCNAGVNGKSFLLCPLCYNNPPFEGMAKNSGCNNCTNADCELSRIQSAVALCKGCKFNGHLVLDAGSGQPKWRIRCNQCQFILEGFEKASEVVVDAKSSCDKCQSKLIHVTYKNDAKEINGCVFCTKELKDLCRTRIGLKLQDMHISDKKTNAASDQAAPAKKTQVHQAKFAVPKYDPANDPNADEFAVRGRGRSFGRGGRGRGSRGGRGGSRGSRGRRGRGRGGHSRNDDGDDDGYYNHFSRDTIKLSDFM